MRWPGLPLSAWGKLDDLKRRLDVLERSRPGEFGRQPTDEQELSPNTPSPAFWVRITAPYDATTGSYSAVSVYPKINGQFANFGTSGPEGQAIADSFPPVVFSPTTRRLYEINGNTSVPVDAVVYAENHQVTRIVNDAFIEEWQFDFSGGGVGEPKFWAVITGASDTRHSWSEVVPTNNGGWLVKPGGRTGSATGANPAFERNLLNNVPPTTIVLMYVGYLDGAPDLQEYVFEYPVPRMQEDSSNLKYQQRLNFKTNIRAANNNVTHATDIDVCDGLEASHFIITSAIIAGCFLAISWEVISWPCGDIVESGTELFPIEETHQQVFVENVCLVGSDISVDYARVSFPCGDIINRFCVVNPGGCCAPSSSSSSSSSCAQPLCWSILDISSQYGWTNGECSACDVECYRLSKTTEVMAGRYAYLGTNMVCCSAPNFSALLFNSQDGYMTLSIDNGNGGVDHYRKTLASWNDCTSNTLTFYRSDTGAGDKYCLRDVTPGSITLHPECCTPTCGSSSSSSSSVTSSSSSSSSYACGDCDNNTTMWLSFPTIAGAGCAELTGEHCLTFVSACLWQKTVGLVNHRIDLQDLGSGVWELKVIELSGGTAIATWRWTGTQSDPCQCMEMTKIADTSACQNFPPLTSVCPVDTEATNCCEACGGMPSVLQASIAVNYVTETFGCPDCEIDPAPGGTAVWAGTVQLELQPNGHWTGTAALGGDACAGFPQPASAVVDFYCDPGEPPTLGCEKFTGTCEFKLNGSTCETMTFNDGTRQRCNCNCVDSEDGINYGLLAEYHQEALGCCGGGSPGGFTVWVAYVPHSFADIVCIGD